jgi:hypothetical protein
MAVPTEQHWRDMKLVSACGGRLLRPGHVASGPVTVAACDAYGVFIAQPSGDDEWLTRNTFPIFDYKKEFHRDLIIRDRNHPSILMWEDNNGDAGFQTGGNNRGGVIQEMINITHTWDHITPRANSPRDWTDVTTNEIVMGYVNGANKGKYPNQPAWNAECWVSYSARHAWGAEKEYAHNFIDSWSIDGIGNNNVFGWVQWYFAETMGENRGFIEAGNNVRSLGCSAMCGNRIPKLIYRIWQNALWIPYEVRPGVALQSHWNYSGNTNVDAWSNCVSVELFVNGKSKGLKTPEVRTKRCTWENVAWEAGTLRAEGKDAAGKVVCSDEKKSAGPADHIVLSVEPALVKPNGEAFKIEANGSDCGFVLATVVDKDGNWCPNWNNTITFAVNGPAEYRGSYNIYVTGGQPTSFHAPEDKSLQAEGGLMKVAVRSTFTAGQISVTASADGVQAGSTSFQTLPVLPHVSVMPGALRGKTLPVGLSLSSYPNPSHAKTMISFSVSTRMHVSVQVFSINGRLIETLVDAPVLAGRQTIPWNASAFGPGLYVVRFKAGDATRMHTCIVQ